MNKCIENVTKLHRETLNTLLCELQLVQYTCCLVNKLIFLYHAETVSLISIVDAFRSSNPARKGSGV